MINKTDLPDENKIINHTYHEKESILIYKNSMCPVCENTTVTVKINSSIEFNNGGDSCICNLFADCCTCMWTCELSRYTMPYEDDENWEKYIDIWSGVREKVLEIYKIYKFNTKLCIWELTENPNVPVCPICKSTNIYREDIDTLKIYSCNDCSYWSSDDEICILPEEIVKKLCVDISMNNNTVYKH